MSWLTRKRRVRLDEFCREFYERQILNPVIAGVDASAAYFDVVKNSVAEADGRAAAISSEAFRAEMTRIYFEVFGLAWLHCFGGDRAAEQSTFTKSYLTGLGRTDVWDTLGPYNQAIAQSSAIDQSPVARARANRARADLFDAWLAQGHEGVPVARAANRHATEAAWSKGITAGLITLVLCERLQCELNEEAQVRLTAVVRGLYDGARKVMSTVRVEM